MMLSLLIVLFAAPADDGPPPYEITVRCAGLSRAWNALHPDEPTSRGQTTRDEMEIWGFATMDAARRAGIKPETAEAAMDEAFAALKPALAEGDEAALADLKTCRSLLPPLE